MKLCLFCNEPITQGDYRKKFCNRRCAASHNNTLRTPESREKQRNTLLTKIKNKQIIYPKKPKVKPIVTYTICIMCDIEFESSSHHCRNKKICSKECYSRYSSKIQKGTIRNREFYNKQPIKSSDYKRYHMKSLFCFDPDEEPLVFGYDDFLKFGKWHRENNRTGLVRDHMFSIKAAWLLELDVTIVKHPANCCGMPMKENSSKSNNCSITLDQLLDRIKRWNVDDNINENFSPTWSKTITKRKNKKQATHRRIYITRNQVIKQIYANQLSAYKKCGWTKIIE